MTRGGGGETDLDRVGHTRRGIGTDGWEDEAGEAWRNSDCTALEDWIVGGGHCRTELQEGEPERREGYIRKCCCNRTGVACHSMS